MAVIVRIPTPMRAMTKGAADVQTKAGIVVTFLALLEMIRLKLVRVFQQGGLGPIRVYKREKLQGAPEFAHE